LLKSTKQDFVPYFVIPFYDAQLLMVAPGLSRNHSLSVLPSVTLMCMADTSGHINYRTVALRSYSFIIRALGERVRILPEERL